MPKPFYDWLIDKYGYEEGTAKFREWQSTVKKEKAEERKELKR